MDKLKYYILHPDRIMKENLPQIDLTHPAITSNDNAIMTDATVDEIGIFAVTKMEINNYEEVDDNINSTSKNDD